MTPRNLLSQQKQLIHCIWGMMPLPFMLAAWPKTQTPKLVTHLNFSVAVAGIIATAVTTHLGYLIMLLPWVTQIIHDGTLWRLTADLGRTSLEIIRSWNTTTLAATAILAITTHLNRNHPDSLLNQNTHPLFVFLLASIFHYTIDFKPKDSIREAINTTLLKATFRNYHFYFFISIYETLSINTLFPNPLLTDSPEFNKL